MNGFSSELIAEPVSAAVMDLPSPPWVEVQGIDNFRDIGGYAVADSATHSIRRNFCYRCADPSRLTPAGAAKITALGITMIYDLRSLVEISKNTAILASATKPDAATQPSEQPFAALAGVTHRFTPVFVNRDFSPQAMGNYARGGPEGFTAAYRDILEFAPDAVRVMLAHVRDRPGEPFVLHCSAGKDRTGVLVALLLKLAGASDDVVAREYELTELGLTPMREMIVRHFMKMPELKDNEAGVWRMVSAKGENMLAALQMLQEVYGGAEGYAKDQCGFTDDDIATIRKNLLEEKPPIL